MIDVGGTRRDLVGGELPDRRAQHVDRLAVVEGQGGEIEHVRFLTQVRFKFPNRDIDSKHHGVVQDLRFPYVHPSDFPCITISVCCISATSVRLPPSSA